MWFFIVASGLVLLFFYVLNIKISKHLLQKDESDQSEFLEVGEEEGNSIIAKLSELRPFVITASGLAGIVFLLSIYVWIKGTPVESYFFEWMNLIIRWAHITFGIAWIGASFYFVFLENALNRTKNVRDELAGNLWAVHGGGFYYLEKYKVAPPKIPRELHWFKYEAYFTWLSGFLLLSVVYYFNAKSFLIDTNVLDITPTQGIIIGIGSLIVSWIVYDVLCKSPWVKDGFAFFIIMFCWMVFLSWFFSNVFSARAAYIHVGAVIGTMMAANVFFVIIPSQKAMVNAAKKGLPLNPQLGKNAGLRSLHNNYFTLPILFIMISNHFPSTFGHTQGWLLLGGISLASAGLKHYLNLSEKGELSVWAIPVSTIILLAVIIGGAPAIKAKACKDDIVFTQVYSIMQERCTTCHSAAPTDDTWTAAPNGVMYDTPEQIANYADKIMQRAVLTTTMPQNNKTGMLPEERKILRCWIEQGAKIE